MVERETSLEMGCDENTVFVATRNCLEVGNVEGHEEKNKDNIDNLSTRMDPS